MASERMPAGCICHGCGDTYRIDVYVPDTVWRQIGMPGPSGLLCGRCIVSRMEGLGEFGAFVLAGVDEVSAAVAGRLGSGWRLCWLPTPVEPS